MAPKPGSITRLRVGRLTKAHGLKGALKVELYTDEPERRFVPGASFSLQVPPESPWHNRSVELAELRWYNEQPVAFFKGIDDRTAAETLVKAILWVDKDDAEELEPDTWYDHQLVGLHIIVDGRKVGVVARVDHLPAQDLIVVKTSGDDVLVPFVRAIVPTVDIQAGQITMTPPGGLFDPEHAEIARADAAEQDRNNPSTENARRDEASSTDAEANITDTNSDN